MRSHGAESLNRHRGAGQLPLLVFTGHLDSVQQAPAGCADFVKWDAADFPGQPHGAADLVPDPAHTLFVRPHVGSEDILLDLFQGTGEGAHQFFLLPAGHGGVAVEYRLAAAVWQVGGGILEGHGPCQAEAFLGAHIRRHAHPADGGPPGDIVHHQGAAQPDRGLVYFDYLEGAELVIGDCRHCCVCLLHPAIPEQCLRVPVNFSSFSRTRRGLISGALI